MWTVSRVDRKEYEQFAPVIGCFETKEEALKFIENYNDWCEELCYPSYGNWGTEDYSVWLQGPWIINGQ